jgi:hypothetical protein
MLSYGTLKTLTVRNITSFQFSITNKTPTNKQIDLLLKKIFIKCLGEKSNYLVSILKVFRHLQQLCATKRRKTEVLLISFPFRNNCHPCIILYILVNLD